MSFPGSTSSDEKKMQQTVSKPFSPRGSTPGNSAMREEFNSISPAPASSPPSSRVKTKSAYSSTSPPPMATSQEKNFSTFSSKDESTRSAALTSHHTFPSDDTTSAPQPPQITPSCSRSVSSSLPSPVTLPISSPNSLTFRPQSSPMNMLGRGKWMEQSSNTTSHDHHEKESEEDEFISAVLSGSKDADEEVYSDLVFSRPGSVTKGSVDGAHRDHGEGYSGSALKGRMSSSVSFKSNVDGKKSPVDKRSDSPKSHGSSKNSAAREQTKSSIKAEQCGVKEPAVDLPSSYRNLQVSNHHSTKTEDTSKNDESNVSKMLSSSSSVAEVVAATGSLAVSSGNTPTSASKSRGLVSRRGGRCGTSSPAARAGVRRASSFSPSHRIRLHPGDRLPHSSTPETNETSGKGGNDQDVQGEQAQSAYKQAATVLQKKDSPTRPVGMNVDPPPSKSPPPPPDKKTPLVYRSPTRTLPSTVTTSDSCTEKNTTSTGSTADDMVPSLCSSESMCSSALHISSSSSSGSHHSPSLSKHARHLHHVANTHRFSPMSSSTDRFGTPDTKHPISRHLAGSAVMDHLQPDHTKSEREERKKSRLQKRKPFSITVKTSCETSPLQLLDDPLRSKAQTPSSPGRQGKSLKESKGESGEGSNVNVNDEGDAEGDAEGETGKDQREKDDEELHDAVPFSPTPTKMNFSDKKHDQGGNNHQKFSSLGPFQDSKLNSPCPFLSPYSPSSLGVIGDSPLPRYSPKSGDYSTLPKSPTLPPKQFSVTHQNPERSSMTTPTPTNFASEFDSQKSPSIDSSGLSFSWLNSPQTIFPPTPKGYDNPTSTPKRESGEEDDTKSDNASTSTPFYLQDASNLRPRDSSTQTTKSAPRNIRSHHPYSNMICISPVASSKKAMRSSKSSNSTASTRSPFKQHRTERSNSIDFHDLFASPRTGANNQSISPSPRSLLPLDLTTGDCDSSLNLHMHMAERDLMEDEDLTVLLQLASNGSGGNGMSSGSGTTILRSPVGQHRQGERETYASGSGPPSSLHLPLMNGPESGSNGPSKPTKLNRKASRDSEFSRRDPPVIPLRSSGSHELERTLSSGMRSSYPERTSQARSGTRTSPEKKTGDKAYTSANSTSSLNASRKASLKRSVSDQTGIRSNSYQNQTEVAAKGTKDAESSAKNNNNSGSINNNVNSNSKNSDNSTKPNKKKRLIVLQKPQHDHTMFSHYRKSSAHEKERMPNYAASAPSHPHQLPPPVMPQGGSLRAVFGGPRSMPGMSNYQTHNNDPNMVGVGGPTNRGPIPPSRHAPYRLAGTPPSRLPPPPSSLDIPRQISGTKSSDNVDQDRCMVAQNPPPLPHPGARPPPPPPGNMYSYSHSKTPDRTNNPYPPQQKHQPYPPPSPYMTNQNANGNPKYFNQNNAQAERSSAPPPLHMPGSYTAAHHTPNTPTLNIKLQKDKSSGSKSTLKRPANTQSGKGGTKKKQRGNTPPNKKSGGNSKSGNKQKGASNIAAQNAAIAAAAGGGKNAHAAALAAAILRGVTMRPSGKWQAQLYYAGKSRYIGVFDTREKAALAYEIAREKLKSDKAPEVSGQTIEDTEAAVSSARKAAFEGVNEPDPRPPHKR